MQIKCVNRPRLSQTDRSVADRHTNVSGRTAISAVPKAAAACHDSGMSELLRWSDSFVVGHEVIDREHRTLVRLINEVGDAARAVDRDRLGATLKSLGHAVADHFRSENSILWELQAGTYDGLKHSAAARRVVAGMASSVFADHMAEHASLLERFGEIANTPLETIGEALKAWFIDHAIKQDAHLKTIFQAMK
jgi:hemerythrin